MNLLSLPPEVRLMIYDFTFPSAHTEVQLIPHRTSFPACHFNLPLSLYRVCKLIHAELPPIVIKLRALNFVYIIRGSFIGRYSYPDDGSRADDDADLAHFQSFLRVAERLRLVGPEAFTEFRQRAVKCSSRRLTAGPECAMRVLEVQPGAWEMRLLMHTMMSCLGPLAVHSDVAGRLQVRLIRDEKEEGAVENEEKWGKIEGWLKRYQKVATIWGDGSQQFGFGSYRIEGYLGSAVPD